jgi:hypothetical protein
MAYAPPTVTVAWSIHAITRGIGGITAAYHTTGSARTATDDMIAWLESRDTTTVIDGVSPVVRVWAVLSSQQLLAGEHEMQSVIQGLPADRAIGYATDWLRLISRVHNWGGGGS